MPESRIRALILPRTVEEVEEFHSVTAEEYSQVSAVLARITGLRLLMVACGLIGGIVSFVVYVYELEILALSLDINAQFMSLSYAIFSLIPFLAIECYLFSRTNKHIKRLSRGVFEPQDDLE